MKGHRASCSCHSHNGFRLSPEGLAQRTGDQLELDGMDSSRYIDSRVSVSGLRRDETHWDYELLEDQYRRFHNGS